MNDERESIESNEEDTSNEEAQMYASVCRGEERREGRINSFRFCITEQINRSDCQYAIERELRFQRITKKKKKTTEEEEEKKGEKKETSDAQIVEEAAVI